MAEVEVDVILQAASRAPSVHNTQPWRFDVRDGAIDVVADTERRLAFLDPAGRQLHLSCGAAVEFAYLATRDVGRACAVELLPERGRPELLARLRPGAPLAPTEQEEALAGAIPIRYTDRGPYTDDPVPPAVVEDVRRRGDELGVWVAEVTRPEDRRALVAVLSDAEAAEAADPRYAAELAAWTAREQSDEGMPQEATAPAWPAERVSEVPLRDFGGANRHPRPGDLTDSPPPSVERDLLLVIGTDRDDPASWLVAGRQLGWTMLRATADGVSTQPLGQAIDLPAGRERLRRELRLGGHPQFVLRLGFGTGRPTTGRRRTTLPG